MSRTKEQEDQVVGTMDVRGKTYEVWLHISDFSGKPSARFQIKGISTARYGNAVVGDTWGEVYDLAMKATKRASVKISIPFMRFVDGRRGNPDTFREGEIVGKHTGNDNLLVKWAGTTATEQELDGYHKEDKWFRPMQPERQAEFIRLRKAAIEAESALNDFRTRFHFNPVEEVEDEIERKAAEIVEE